MGGITWEETVIWAVYFVLILLLLVIYRAGKKTALYNYFIAGFLLKVLGGLSFAFIYIFYYKFGDTFLYHQAATVLSQTLIDSPGDYFRLLMSENANLPADLSNFSKSISYSRGAEEWFMVKLLSPINFISFQSYLVTTLFMSLIAFIGSWKLFQVFNDLLPNRFKLTFLAAFLIPSTLIWGGGIMKDTFTLAGINIIIYCLYFTFYKGQINFFKYTMILIAAYVVFFLKSYVLIAFVPGLLFGVNALVKDKIQNNFLRNMLGAFLLFITAAILYIGPIILEDASTKYTSEALKGRVQGFHSWHTDVGGATYSLGEVDYSAIGILSKAPAALNVTFFRPYLWEVSNIVVLLASIESTILFLFFLYLIYKLRLNFIRITWKYPMLITFAIYCVIFGFVVGFTSYNFGALGRYKIPVFSLFVFILIFLYSKLTATKDSVAKAIND